MVFRRFVTRRIKNHPKDIGEPRELLPGLLPTDLFPEFLLIELDVPIERLVTKLHSTAW
jgi:hypothetical protein